MRATRWMTSAGLATILAPWVSPVFAQTCFRGQPAPACHRFVVTEVGVSYRLNGAGDPSVPEPQRIYINGDVGLMWNRSGGWALGGSLYGGALVDYAFTVRLGAKARLRRWLTTGIALDLGAGPLVGSVPRGDGAYGTAVGVTTSAELVFTDRLSIINIVEFMPDERGTDAAWYLGGRLGSWPGAVVSGIAMLVMGLAGVATIGW